MEGTIAGSVVGLPVASLLARVIGAPSTRGETPEQIERERYDATVRAELPSRSRL